MQERRISLKYVQIISVSIGTYFKKIGIVDKKKTSTGSGLQSAYTRKGFYRD
jgi:hypothetical protein